MSIDYNLAWRFINEQVFDGELVPAKIHCFRGTIWGVNNQRLFGTLHCQSSEILLHIGYYANDHPGGPLETLYHEMVHQYIEEVLLDGDDHADHGWLFHEVYRDGCEKLYNKGNMVMAKKMVKGKAAKKSSARTNGSGQAGVGPPGIKAKYSKGRK